jgi:hypothetical protein
MLSDTGPEECQMTNETLVIVGLLIYCVYAYAQMLLEPRIINRCERMHVLLGLMQHADPDRVRNATPGLV